MINDRYQALEDIELICHYDLKFTKSIVIYSASLKANHIIRILSDNPDALSVKCIPENYKELEPIYVPLKFRLKFWQYRGYHFFVERKMLAHKFKKF